MVNGGLQWREHGLAVPTIVRDATDLYLSDQDTITQWAEEWIDVDPRQDFILTRTLFASWDHWCEQRKFASGTEREFSDTLADQLGYERARRSNGRGFKGIALKAHNGPTS
jgi:phage/plasmid-associated DNA primase